MTDASEVDPPATVKRRQYLLLAGIGAAIGGAALLSVSLTGTRNSAEQPSKPKSTNILAPGAQDLHHPRLPLGLRAILHSRFTRKDLGLPHITAKMRDFTVEADFLGPGR